MPLFHSVRRIRDSPHHLVERIAESDWASGPPSTLPHSDAADRSTTDPAYTSNPATARRLVYYDFTRGRARLRLDYLALTLDSLPPRDIDRWTTGRKTISPVARAPSLDPSANWRNCARDSLM